jgi:hypothetical protein
MSNVVFVLDDVELSLYLCLVTMYALVFDPTARMVPSCFFHVEVVPTIALSLLCYIWLALKK